MYECDKVKDNSNIRDDIYGYGKLVLLKANSPKKMTVEQYEPVAVFAVWTSWTKVPDNAEKCERCARYRILNKNYYCHDCQRHIDFESKQPCQRAP